MATQHVLVVGGSGMLAEAVDWLLSQGYHVSVIGRNRGRLERLRKMSPDPKRLLPLPLDYRDDHVLRQEVRRCQQHFGPIDMVVAWIHSVAPRALDVIVDEILAFREEALGRGDVLPAPAGSPVHPGSSGPQRSPDPLKIYHVLGSASNLEAIKKSAAVASRPDCDYRQVQLGFVIEDDGRSRWLTNREISDGVIRAIREDRETTVVGTLEPWDRRP